MPSIQSRLAVIGIHQPPPPPPYPPLPSPPQVFSWGSWARGRLGLGRPPERTARGKKKVPRFQATPRMVSGLGDSPIVQVRGRRFDIEFRYYDSTTEVTSNTRLRKRAHPKCWGCLDERGRYSYT